MEKIKKISKYALNILTIVNALLIGLAPIWGWNVEQVIETIAVVSAVISTYLLGQKAYNSLNIDGVTPDYEDEEE